MEKVAIVILNYLNYYDTIECVDSIYELQYDIAGIVIVDNGSANESYNILKQKYMHKKKVIVVRANKNYGFAKGNNIGIEIARKRYGTDFIYVVNNDVVFKDKFFFDKLLSAYDGTIGMIGSKIILANGQVQNPYSEYVYFPEVWNFYLALWIKITNKDIWLKGLPQFNENRRKKIIHGCGILFTPAYFRIYKGFYPKTFLYCEEVILYLMCDNRGLKQKHVEDTYIIHKEDQSSEMSFKNDSRVRRRYILQSYKYVIWWALKNKLYKRIFCR